MCIHICHPLYATHAIKFNPDNLKIIPNFIGPHEEIKVIVNITAPQCLHYLSLGILGMT